MIEFLVGWDVFLLLQSLAVIAAVAAWFLVKGMAIWYQEKKPGLWIDLGLGIAIIVVFLGEVLAFLAMISAIGHYASIDWVKADSILTLAIPFSLLVWWLVRRVYRMEVSAVVQRYKNNEGDETGAPGL